MSATLPSRRIDARARRALAVRHHAALQVLRQEPGLSEDDRLDLLAAVVAPDDPYLGLSEHGEPPGEDEFIGSSGVLTPRQRAILQAVSGGWTARQAATHLRTSYENVKKQLYEARKRLGAQTTAEAVAIAFRAGLIR